MIQLLAILLLRLAAPGLPPIPPLPEGSWPSPAAAEPFARELMARVPAGVLARTLAGQPELAPAILRNLGTAAMTNDRALHDALQTYLTAVAHASASATPNDVQRLTAIAVVDPLRYQEDRSFRARINAWLPRTLTQTPPPVAVAILAELTKSAALDFDTGEAVAAAAHLIPRASSARRVPYEPELRVQDDLSGPIEASIFSLSTSFFSGAEAKRFLQSVRRSAPERRILVLGDAAMRDALGPVARDLRIDVLDDTAHSFTPWPRDPFVVARSAKGNVVFVNRPNPQPGREDDQLMARAIVQQLPAAADRAWSARWTVAPTPFHNGHILVTPANVWITIHALEPRILSILGLDRVPAESFGDPRVLSRYLDAARTAASELGTLYGLPVRFVHPLPSGPGAAEEMTAIGGGAGIDLDSILTLLPRVGGRVDALVGDIALGVAEARRATAAEWLPVRDAYHFRGEPESVRRAVIASQQSDEGLALQRFLDQIAEELGRDGMTVRRLPLLSVPATLLARQDVAADFRFLITWNNVVLEDRAGSRRAEGFASLLPSADRLAREAFAASGYRLILHPPLTNSIVRGGGYRCASNHLRPPKRKSPTRRTSAGIGPFARATVVHGNPARACLAAAMSAAYRSFGAVFTKRVSAARASRRFPARPSTSPMLYNASYCRGSMSTARCHDATARE